MPTVAELAVVIPPVQGGVEAVKTFESIGTAASSSAIKIDNSTAAISRAGAASTAAAAQMQQLTRAAQFGTLPTPVITQYADQLKQAALNAAPLQTSWQRLAAATGQTIPALKAHGAAVQAAGASQLVAGQSTLGFVASMAKTTGAAYGASAATQMFGNVVQQATGNVNAIQPSLRGFGALVNLISESLGLGAVGLTRHLIEAVKAFGLLAVAFAGIILLRGVVNFFENLVAQQIKLAETAKDLSQSLDDQVHSWAAAAIAVRSYSDAISLGVTASAAAVTASDKVIEAQHAVNKGPGVIKSMTEDLTQFLDVFTMGGGFSSMTRWTDDLKENLDIMQKNAAATLAAARAVTEWAEANARAVSGASLKPFAEGLTQIEGQISQLENQIKQVNIDMTKVGADPARGFSQIENLKKQIDGLRGAGADLIDNQRALTKAFDENADSIKANYAAGNPFLEQQARVDKALKDTTDSLDLSVDGYSEARKAAEDYAKSVEFAIRAQKAESDIKTLLEAQYNLGLSQEFSATAAEKQNRAYDQLDRTITALADPTAHLDELLKRFGGTEAENNIIKLKVAFEETERAAKKLDDEIKIGAASAWDSFIRGAEKAADGVANTSRVWAEFGSQVFNILSNDLSRGLSDIIEGTKGVAKGFKDMAVSILKDLSEMALKLAIEIALLQVLKSVAGGIGGFSLGLSSGGAVPGKQTGGPIYGGSGSRDDVPILAMAGEFMLSKADVARKGGVSAIDQWRKMQTGGEIDIPPADLSPTYTTAPSIEISGALNPAAPSPTGGMTTESTTTGGGAFMEPSGSFAPATLRQYTRMSRIGGGGGSGYGFGRGFGQWGYGLANWNRMFGSQGFRGAGENFRFRQTRHGEVPLGGGFATFGARNRLMMPRLTAEGGYIFPIPSFQHGGTMPWDGLAQLHKGENISPAGASTSSVTNAINVHVEYNGQGGGKSSTTGSDDADARALAEAIRITVVDQIAKQRRFGGELYQPRNR